jgi:hypothetical protein
MELLFIVILSVLTLLLGYGTYNLLRKNEALEDELDNSDAYIQSVYGSMKNAYDRMIKIDRLGSFESDDESGYIFDEIKSSIENLNEKYNLDAEEEKK